MADYDLVSPPVYESPSQIAQLLLQQGLTLSRPLSLPLSPSVTRTRPVTPRLSTTTPVPVTTASACSRSTTTVACCRVGHRSSVVPPT